MGVIQLFITWFFPFLNQKCVYCGNKFDISYSLFRGHSGTGMRYVHCRRCGKSNINDGSDKLKLVDNDTLELVESKEAGRNYSEGKFSILNSPFAIALINLLILFIVLKLYKLFSH